MDKNTVIKRYLGPDSKGKKCSKEMREKIIKIRKFQEKMAKEQKEKAKEQKKKRELEYLNLSPWESNKILYPVYDKIINADPNFKYKSFKDYLVDYDNGNIEEEQYLENKDNCDILYEENYDNYLDNNTYYEGSENEDFINYYSDDYSDSENEY